MRKFIVLVGVALVALLATASSALAEDFKCEGTFTGETFDDVTVPRGAACKLVNSTVAGDVEVLRDAYFEAGDTAIGGDVEGRRAQTIFIDTDSRVFGHVHGHGTIQVFIFNATVIRSIFVEDATDVVDICGTTVFKGNVTVEDSGQDILIGSSDPGTECAGNFVRRGDVEVEDNFVFVELVIEANTIPRGDLEVLRNDGHPAAPKLVRNNSGGDDLRCKGNSEPFVATGNTGWDEISGQCRP
jgi:hypothetical protein